MTYQERNAEGPPVGEPPFDLLTPKKVRETLDRGSLGWDITVARLCRDYLTLWERNKELEAVMAHDSGVEGARESYD